MSLGLYLKGQFLPSKQHGVNPSVFDRAKMDELERWLANVAYEELEWSQWTEDDDGSQCLMVALHPGAEPIMLSTHEDGSLLISASTSSAGPGYHIFVCDLLRKMGQVHGIEWYADEENDYFDETGFFHTGDRAKLYAEFELWIRALAKRVKELARDGAKFHLAMPFDGHQFEVTEPILTQLGPRSFAWLDQVCEEPILGKDIFPWWEDGHGAEYHLGRALCHMWNTVRWREPLTEEEEDLLEICLQHLDSAYGLDPDLNFPFVEWSQIVDYLGATYELGEMVEERAESLKRNLHSLIGYRRRSVRKDLGGGWSIALPGNFVEDLEEGQTFLAYDDKKNLRVTCMAASDPVGKPLDAMDILGKIKVLDDPLKHERGKVNSRAFFERVEQDGTVFWMLRGVSACDGSFAQITICFEEDRDRDWALDTWQSLDHRSNYQQASDEDKSREDKHREDKKKEDTSKD